MLIKRIELSFKLPRFLNDDKIFLFLVLLIFILISSYKLDKIPGFYEDEGLSARRAKQIIYGIDANPNLAITAGSYVTHISLIFFLIFDISVLSSRISTVFLSIFSLVFSYLFVKKLFDVRIARISLLLQAFFPGFIIFSRFGGWPHTYYMFPVSMVLYLSLKWFKTRDTKFLYLSSLLIGFGINIHVPFFYFLLSLLVSVTVSGLGFIKVHKRVIFVFFFIMFVSAYPYLGYQFNNVVNEILNPTKVSDYLHNSILLHISRNLIVTSFGLENLNFIENLRYRIFLLDDFLSGNVDLEICDYYLRSFLLPIIFYLSLFFMSMIAIKKSRHSKEAFVLILFFVMFIGMCFTVSELLRTHFLLTFPIPFIIIGYALSKAIDLFKPSVVFLFLLITMNLLVVFDYYSCLNRTGGNGYFSVEIDNLIDYLEESDASSFTILDWGLFNNLIFLSNDSRFIGMPYTSHSNSWDEREITLIINSFEYDTFFIIPSSQFTNFSEIENDFLELSQSVGKEVQVKKIFYSSSGKRVYTVYGVAS